MYAVDSFRGVHRVPQRYAKEPKESKQEMWARARARKQTTQIENCCCNSHVIYQGSDFYANKPNGFHGLAISLFDRFSPPFFLSARAHASNTLFTHEHRRLVYFFDWDTLSQPNKYKIIYFALRARDHWPSHTHTRREGKRRRIHSILERCALGFPFKFTTFIIIFATGTILFVVHSIDIKRVGFFFVFLRSSPRPITVAVAVAAVTAVHRSRALHPKSFSLWKTLSLQLTSSTAKDFSSTTAFLYI